MLADIAMGSNTPKMVSKLMEWKNSFPEIGKYQLLDSFFIKRNRLKTPLSYLLDYQFMDVSK